MLAPGFQNPALDSQATFRTVMDAVANPGQVHRIDAAFTPPSPLSRAMAATVLALVDFETPVWLDPVLAQHTEVRAWLAFHTGAPIVRQPSGAAFALVGDAERMPNLSSFAQGSDEYPDLSATVLIAVDQICDTAGTALSGPGIKDQARLDVRPLTGAFWADCARNHAGFPKGVDLLFTAGRRIAALPRSTRISRDPQAPDRRSLVG